MVSFRPAPITIKKSQKVQVIKTLTEYAQKLLSTQLISVKTADQLITAIKNLDLRSEYEVTKKAGILTEKQYFLTPGKLGEFVRQLLSKQIITQASHDEIMAKSAAGKFNDYDEVLKYMKNFVILDMEKYPGAPEDYMEAVYRKTGNAMEGLDFDSIKYTVEHNKKESHKDFLVYDMAVVLRKKEVSYRYRSFFNAEYKNKQAENTLKLPENYYEVFNKMLADERSPYRLHLVNISKESFGILALTKKQFDGLQWMYDGMTVGGYLNLSYENFNNKLTQKKIRETIALYDSIGLLSHLTKTEKDSCIKEIEGKEINYYSDILSSFTKLVFEIDLEYGVNDGQYKKITSEIAGISKGTFAPTDIVDAYNYVKRKSFDYGFTLNGKKYLRQLKQEDDWLDTGFWELIEQAVKEQDTRGKFYYLHPADGMRQVYLTNEQAALLRPKKMIELEEKDLEN